ncbi:DUF695 domain-containing protein [Maribacter sp.]|uniref:DUF695 domain-containing protein n=1 Tax=Maribacter sp. TaxID=1897614 RepID=UPI0032995E4B
MKDYFQYVVFKDEFLVEIPLEMNSIPGLCIVNKSLCNFDYKKIFPWNLTLRLKYEDKDDDLRPTRRELSLINKFRLRLENEFNLNEKPSALFIVNICYSGEADLVWMLHDADITNTILKKIIENKEYQYDFGYNITYDVEWEEVSDYLDI